MTEPTPDTPQPSTELPNPWQCIVGSIVAGGIAIVLYTLTSSISQTFAANPPTGNMTALRIAAAVRTLIIGLSALGTGIFGLASLGLFGLGVQILLKRTPQNTIPPSDSQS